MSNKNKWLAFASMTWLIASTHGNLYILNKESEVFGLLKKAVNLRAEVLDLALKANHCLRNLGYNKQNVLSVFDYTLPSNKRRFWVMDLDKNTILFQICAAHGKNTGGKYARHFSNTSNSKQSSIGVFLTGNTYYGKHGLSLNLHGLEPKYNSNAYARRVVIHSAKYVSESFVKSRGHIGRSWGCPALNRSVTKPVINIIKGGSVYMAYFQDKNWLKDSPVLHCLKDELPEALKTGKALPPMGITPEKAVSSKPKTPSVKALPKLDATTPPKKKPEKKKGFLDRWLFKDNKESKPSNNKWLLE